MIETLYQYLEDTENPEYNYELARKYHKIKQTASAISFYLRCAERTDNLELQYECILQMYICFREQKNRQYTEKGLLQKAISILPKRPEAYYLLSRHYEWNKEYTDSYLIAEISLNVCDFNCIPLRSFIEYKGKYQIIFEKAVSSWWVGKGRESRELFQLLLNDYCDIMDDSHKKMVEFNLSRLGLVCEGVAFTQYDKKNYSKLIHKFPNSELIENNFSQIYQDIFILSVLDGKRNGTFLEIGGADPFLGNNTALLENNFDWSGISVEYSKELAMEYEKKRKSKVICADALSLNYEEILKNNFKDTVIDYLQLDIEPATQTYECMLKIPFDEYKFRVITFEHDHYVDISRTIREKSRNFLKSKGYELFVNDLSPDGLSTFEDWWIHPELIDKNIIKKMKCVDNLTKKAEDYIFSKIKRRSFSFIK
jgi:hypothetical protein